MTIDELLNQQSCTQKNNPTSLTIEILLHYGGFDIGVENQEQKDMLEGYLLVIGSSVKVFIHDFFCHTVQNHFTDSEAGY